MGVFTYETEFASVCAPARLYNALVLDADNLIPKIAPQAIKSAEILEGDGGSEYSYVKHKVDGIDKDNFLYSYSLIEGDVISDKIEKISYETKLVASGSGSVIKSTSHYHTKGDVEIKEEHVKAGKERAHGLFKLIENYLLSIITMGVFTYETEFASVCAPARLYNALVLDADNLIPKIAPQAVKTAEILEGDGGSEYSYVKHKVDGIDKDNFLYSYSLIEGDVISDKIEKISYETKLVASGSGSVIKSTSHYHTKGDVEIKEEHVKAGKERAHGLFKLIENYLVANPDAYN
ncbi:unnamed protein product [Malus baccata var. baccata]